MNILQSFIDLSPFVYMNANENFVGESDYVLAPSPPINI